MNFQQRRFCHFDGHGWAAVGVQGQEEMLVTLVGCDWICRCKSAEAKAVGEKKDGLNAAQLVGLWWG